MTKQELIPSKSNDFTGVVYRDMAEVLFAGMGLTQK